MKATETRLISAAPELLAACKELTRGMAAIVVTRAEPADDQQRAAMAEARRIVELGWAAIKKAEGSRARPPALTP